jgi:L-amino acid N-acyltransferase YncA/2-polyprenyl-3-methyl-5-hydroxy-6-metoxy-1,4-benzoquinol methylase
MPERSTQESDGGELGGDAERGVSTTVLGAWAVETSELDDTTERIAVDGSSEATDRIEASAPSEVTQRDPHRDASNPAASAVSAPPASEAKTQRIEAPGAAVRHYTRSPLLSTLLDALAAAGKSVSPLDSDDLAPLDELHSGGRPATVELADLLAPAPGGHVLDLGAGLGGPARYLARHRGCRVTGVDLARETVEVATELTERCGLDDVVRFREGSVTELPFADTSFDAAIMLHVGMNVADKAALCAEAFRVLRPGGRLGLSDMIASGGLGPGQRAAAERLTGCTTGTITAGEYRDLLLRSGFTGIRVTVPGTPEPGVHAAVIQAVRPAAPAGILIRPMRPADAAGVLAVYQAGLDTGNASFETAAPAWEEFDRARLGLHRHVATGRDGEVLGWTAASAVSDRCVYAGVVEHSVYVAPGARGRGIGAALLAALAGSTEAAGIWTIQTGIFPENTASIGLHERAGFRAVGTRRRVGRHLGRWRDVLMMERRSTVAGTG